MSRKLGRFIHELESRRLLSAVLTDGLLTIEGTRRSDTIEVALTRLRGGTPAVRVTVNGQTTFFRHDAVDSIRINAGQGNDRIEFRTRQVKTVGGTLVKRTGLPSPISPSGIQLYSTAPADTADAPVPVIQFDPTLPNPPSSFQLVWYERVGGFRDTIIGTKDFVESPDAPTLITAGDGNDTVIAGDGDDVIFGGAGDDSLCGNDGDDDLSGDTGNDTLAGGGARDRLRGGDGDDDLAGDSNFLDFMPRGYTDPATGPDPRSLHSTRDEVIGGQGRDTFYDSDRPTEFPDATGRDTWARATRVY